MANVNINVNVCKLRIVYFNVVPREASDNLERKGKKMLEFFLSKTIFYACSKNCEKRLLASSLMSARPSFFRYAWNNSTTTRWIFMKFYSSVFSEKICRQI